MKKRVLALAAAAVMATTAVGALAGCGGGNTIDVLLLANAHEDTFYLAYFKEMEETLQEEGYNYKIRYRGQQEADYYNSLKGAIQSGDTPDIFYVRPNELMVRKTQIASLQDFAEAHGFTDDESAQFANLNDIYDKALDMYRFNPETNEIGNVNDDLYAFPKDLSVQQLGYNRKQLEKYESAIKNTDNFKKTAKLKMPWEMNFETENYSWEDFKIMCQTIADTAKAQNITLSYPCDVPSIEILAKSYGVDMIDIASGTVTDPGSGPLHDAIEFQSKFIACGAGDYENATYANFGAGRVCFYGAVASWEIGEYNQQLNKDDEGNPIDEQCWGIMPWPTTDGSTNWLGRVTSAGYVVSKKCANSGEKGEVAMRIALSFLSDYTQEKMVKDEKICLPLRESVTADYLNHENDSIYSLPTREYYIDVVTGTHGFTPAEYKTFNSEWLEELDKSLVQIWTAKENAMTTFGSINWGTVKTRMQALYEETL